VPRTAAARRTPASSIETAPTPFIPLSALNVRKLMYCVEKVSSA
jgi:hypothetical protein